MSASMARSSFSTAAFAQLVRRLRHTNARYDQIARQFRCRFRPTYHAKRRAYRAGLRIDTSGRVHPLPAVDRSSVSPSCVGSPANVYAEIGPAHGGQEDAYTLPTPPRDVPRVVVRRPRRRGGRPRVTLRLPPYRPALNFGYGCDAPYQGPVPGAPRLLPKQLPEEESGVEEMMLGWSSVVDSSLAPAPMHSGLCITIPPRGAKRKLHDVEEDAEIAPSQQPKRVLKALWNESQTQ